jgi:hypothetical protein
MKSALLLCALFSPCLAFSASLTGTLTTSTATVDLNSVGTVDWARWPGYKHKAGLISDVTIVGPSKSYTTDQRVIGDRSGIKATGVGSKFTITVPAATTERTLRLYIGGWNSKGIVTATLPGATTYTASKSSSEGYSLVLTLKYSSAVAATLRVEYREAWDGTGNGGGSIELQAAALSGAAAVTSGSALLTWNAPSTYTDGSTLTDLAGYKVYWGNAQGSYQNSYQINNGGASSYTVKGLAAGRWYFRVTSLTAAGQESTPTPELSKLIQ